MFGFDDKDDDKNFEIDSDGDFGVSIGNGMSIDSDGDIGFSIGNGMTIDSDGDIGFKF